MARLLSVPECLSLVEIHVSESNITASRQRGQAVVVHDDQIYCASVLERATSIVLVVNKVHSSSVASYCRNRINLDAGRCSANVARRVFSVMIHGHCRRHERRATLLNDTGKGLDTASMSRVGRTATAATEGTIDELSGGGNILVRDAAKQLAWCFRILRLRKWANHLQLAPFCIGWRQEVRQ